VSGLRHISPRGWIAIALVAASMIIAVISFSRVTFYRKQLQARRVELAELNRLQAGIVQQRGALDWINTNAGKAQSLASLIKQFLPGIKNDLILRDSTGAGEGWNIQQYDLRIDEAAPDKIGRFLTACENAKPPVRIVDIQVSPGPENARGLLVQLTLAEMTATTPQSTP
jgi:hypothetical protein